MDNVKKRLLVYSILLLIIVVGAGLAYWTIETLKDQIKDEILSLSIKDIQSIVKNFNKKLVKSADQKNIVEFLKENQAFRKTLESNFEVLITKDIKYVFLLYRDKEGKFRFLVDGSIQEKASLGEIFQPLPEELKLLKKVYATKKSAIAIHKEIDTLGFTLIDPVVRDNQVEAVIFVDFSTSKFHKISSIIERLKFILFLSAGLTLILLTISLFITIKTYTYRKKAYIDPLTGLYNRNYLRDLKINPQNYTVAIMDIDDFKKINDTYGHDVGDIVLKEVAFVIKNSIREKEDIPIRFGGEEFLILLKRKKDFKELNALERLMEHIRNKEISTKDKKIKVTASIGVDLTYTPEETLFERIRKADKALYCAKNRGKNRIEIYKENFGEGEGSL